MEQMTVPFFSFSSHQLRSWSRPVSGRCGMKGFLAHVANMLSRPVRYISKPALGYTELHRTV